MSKKIIKLAAGYGDEGKKPYKLIDKATGQEVQIGDKVTTFRGTKATLKDFEPGKTEASSGRVYLEIRKEEICCYPDVIGCRIVSA